MRLGALRDSILWFIITRVAVDYGVSYRLLDEFSDAFFPVPCFFLFFLFLFAPLLQLKTRVFRPKVIVNYIESQ